MFRKASFVVLLLLILPTCNDKEPIITEPPESPPVGVVGTIDIVKWVGEKLAAGAASKVGGEGVGWIMNIVGLGDPVAEQTLQMLNQISSQLTQLSSKVDDLKRQLNDVDYNTLAASLITTASSIRTAHQLLASLAALPAGTDSISRANQIRDIMAMIGPPGSIMANKGAIAGAMLGSGTAGGGMIEKWSRAVAGRQHFFNQSASDAQQQMYEYWLSLQAIQEELIIDYMHYAKYDSTAIRSELRGYYETMAAQIRRLPWPLANNPDTPYGLVIAKDGGWAGSGLMINAHAFATRGKMSYETAVSTVATMQGDAWGFRNWRLPNAFIGTRHFESDDVAAIFLDPYAAGDNFVCPYAGSVAPWMTAQGWGPTEFPSGALSTFSFFTTGEWDWSHIIFLASRQNGCGSLTFDDELGGDRSSYLLPVRDLPPLPDDARMGEVEFYFYR